jgi:hypothetical protein
VEEQVRAAPKIEQSKRIRVHALVSSSASVVPRLAQNPISGDVSHGAADKADNAGLNQLAITARPELPPKGTPEIFVSFAWGDDSSEDARTEVVDRLCETLGQHGWHILRDSNVLRSGDLISGFMKAHRACRSRDRGAQRQVPALALLHDRVALHLSTFTRGKRRLLASYHPAGARRRTGRHLA